MGAPRQQRATRNRRTLGPGNPAVIPALSPVIVSTTMTGISIRGLVIPQPPTGSGSPQPLQLNGIPAIWRPVTSSYPATATLNPDGITIDLDWASAGIEAGESFWLGLNDPAVRGSNGSFLAGGEMTLPTPLPPAHPTADYTATATGANQVTVVIPQTTSDLVLWRSDFFAVGAGGTDYPATATQAGHSGVFATITIVLDYAVPVASGDRFAYDGPPINVGNDGITTLSNVAQTVI